MAEQASLILKDIRISLAGNHLLDVNTEIPPGDVLTVMGPSGSGKSTLLAYVSGFLAPAFKAKGKVFSGELDITAMPPEKRHAGILFQDPLLFPHMTVRQNLTFALPASSRGRIMRKEAAEKALSGVGLAGYGDRHTATLSGGQSARIALARVLLSEPRMLLLDEPFSRLDAALRGQMRELVFTTARRSRLPVILVTHDEADAEAAGGKVIRIGDDI